MVEVIPGILEQSFTTIVDKIRMVEEICPWIQIDLLDGTLFGNSCFHNPKEFTNLRTPTKLELHMMVVNPEQLIGEWSDAGFDRFIGHVEGMTNVEAFITAVRTRKKEVGLALDIDTDLSLIERYLPNIDVALIMSIPTGKSGQTFDEHVVTKIQKLRLINKEIPVEVDGGINLETGLKVKQAGATRLVSTSFIFNSTHVLQTINKLKSI